MSKEPTAADKFLEDDNENVSFDTGQNIFEQNFENPDIHNDNDFSPFDDPNPDDDDDGIGGDGDNETPEQKQAREAAELAEAAKNENNNDDDDESLSLEELKKKALAEHEQNEVQQEVLNSQIKELATELNLSTEEGKVLGIDEIKAEIKRLKDFESVEDQDIRDIMVFKSQNPDKTMVDYYKKMVSPYGITLALDNTTLMVEYEKNVNKKSDDEARELVAQYKHDGIIEEKAKTVRETLINADTKWKLQRDVEMQKMHNKEKSGAKANTEALFNAMSGLKETFMDGRFKVSNGDILKTISNINSGNFDKMVKDPAVKAKLAFYLQNEQKIMKVLEEQGIQKGKGLILETQAEASRNKSTPRRSNERSAPGSITASEWD